MRTGIREIRDRQRRRGSGGTVYFWTLAGRINKESNTLNFGSPISPLYGSQEWASFSEIEDGNDIEVGLCPWFDISKIFNMGDYLYDDDCFIGSGEDIFIEFVFRRRYEYSQQYPMGFGMNPYFQLWNPVTSLWVLTSLNTISIPADEYAFDVLHIALDRDGSLYIYRNGAFGVSQVNNLLTAFDEGDIWLGAPNETAYGNSEIADIKIWKGTDLIVPANIAAVCHERTHKIVGSWPRVAVGTWVPTVCNRACVAFADFEDRIIGWGRYMPRVITESGKLWYISELQRTNLINESEDLSTTWTTTRCSIDSGAADSPDPLKRADGIVANTDNDTHYIEYSMTLADGEYHAVSFFAKAGNKSWIKLVWDRNGTPVYCYFNLSTGVIGSNSGLTGYLMREYSDGWYRFWVRKTADNPDTLYFYPADSDGDETFAGDGSTVNVYIWGVQAEQDRGTSSYIPTHGATATRLKDELTYKGDDGNIPVGSGQLSFELICPNPDFWDLSNPGWIEYLVSLSDGGDYNNSIFVRLTIGEPSMFVASMVESGSYVYVSRSYPTVTNGSKHTVVVRWDTDYLYMSLDGSSDESTASATVPNDLDSIEIGHQNGANQSGNVLISNVKIQAWSKS